MRQVRKLGIKVPRSYQRIQSIKLMPSQIQEELVKYPETIENDSSYEDDDAVLKKYKEQPLKYILGADHIKKMQLQDGGEPVRIHEARKARGIENIKEISAVILLEAS